MVVRKLGGYLDEFTLDWVGWRFPPVRQALELSGWRPDSRDEYCGRCGDSVGPGEFTERGCATCREGAELEGGIGDGVVRLGPYVDELRDWILKVKYECWSEMGQCLGGLLANQFMKLDIVDRQRLLVVPMPMPWQRRLYRGIDHARVIASALAKPLDAPLVSVLKRSHHTPQVALSSSERKRAGSRGMRVRSRLGGWRLQGAHLVIVDDVRTTGATLKAATRLLRALKPERIVCAVIGVSDSKARQARGKRLGRAHGQLANAVVETVRETSSQALDRAVSQQVR